MRGQLYLIGSVVLAVVACADGTAATAPPAPRPNPSHVVEEEADAGVIVRVRDADVFLDLYNKEVSGWMYYDGLAARMQGNATVNDDGGSATYPLQSPIQRKYGIWNFFGNTYGYAWPLPVRHSCGTTMWASINFYAWVDGLSLDAGIMKWSEDDDQRTGSRSQTPCGVREEEIDPPADGGGSGGGTIEPPVDNLSHSKCVVRIKYDLETGDVISITKLYCY